jgi:1-acyl-sn-glycerol-3-phosphate acyltransferase
MYEIMDLSGQEYVDVYATKAKDDAQAEAKAAAAAAKAEAKAASKSATKAGDAPPEESDRPHG